ncbi:hypothetical protein OHB26_20750 [Nocardia sp. NBC_01503]|uniref:hypothetical protein n=1 Tax=Nocardia sp. NBC_01503 TaxID=2975997 RepID=UPI002E7B0CC5|nr:hypothetical protein [Nocardia sp. NBC_01503]WTL29432.1 hypothetical protein OHB26_20750 [Nocardia sp. NBC_01503]
MRFGVRAAIAVATMGISSILTVPVSAARPVPLPQDPSHAKPAASITVSPNALAQRMQSAVQSVEPRAETGIEVVDTESGALLAAVNDDKRFYTASVVKLLIALDVLGDGAGQRDSAAVQRMLSASDDAVASRLWGAAGGAEIITRMSEKIGLTATSASSHSGQWGETLTTARDVMAIYRYLVNEAPLPARDLILDALGQAAEIAADGVDQYFGIPDAMRGCEWAVKQGWMWVGSSLTLNSTGLVGPDLRYAVVLLSSQPTVSISSGGAALTAGVGVLREAMGL